MITVSSITKNPGRNALIRTAFFFIPVNFAFNLPHHAASYMHHTGKKRVEKIFKQKTKKKGTKNSLQGDSNPDPQNQLELNVSQPSP